LTIPRLPDFARFMKTNPFWILGYSRRDRERNDGSGSGRGKGRGEGRGRGGGCGGGGGGDDVPID